MAHLALTTKVDHYAKVLDGQKLFYLWMYGVLENDRLSRTNCPKHQKQKIWVESMFGNKKVEYLGAEKNVFRPGI